MAPGIHPPCQPSASCQPVRCHPMLPPCQDPIRCLKKCASKKVKPCPSAVSIMSTKQQMLCGRCGRFRNFKGRRIADNNKLVRKYLKRKSKENRLKRHDRLFGTNKFDKYSKKKGSKRLATDCCAGHGHRGRMKRGIGKKLNPAGTGRGCCVIL